MKMCVSFFRKPLLHKGTIEKYGREPTCSPEFSGKMLRPELAGVRSRGAGRSVRYAVR